MVFLNKDRNTLKHYSENHTRKQISDTTRVSQGGNEDPFERDEKLLKDK